MNTFLLLILTTSLATITEARICSNSTATSTPIFPIWNDTDMPAVRYFLNMAAVKTPPTPMIVIAYNVSKRHIRELLTVDHLILLHGVMPSSSHDENAMTIISLHLASLFLQDQCMLLLSRKHHIMLPTSHKRREYSKFMAFSSECDTVLTRFQSPYSTMLLVPPRLHVPQLYERMANWSTSLNVSTASSLLSSFHWVIRPYMDGFERQHVFRANPMSCYKSHVLRSPIRVNPIRSGGGGEDGDGPTVCLCVPLHGKSPHFVTTTIRSLMTTLSNPSNVSHIKVFAAIEESDTYLGLPRNQNHLVRKVLTEMDDDDISFSFYITIFPYIEQDIVYLWNSLFLQAYETGCDYLMHITSDVDFGLTPGAGYGWMDKFVTLLQNNGNIGAIGNVDVLNTMPFVHRTHIEIFEGKFYSNVPHNIFSDTSLWLIYKAFALLVGPDDLERWVNLSDYIPEEKRAQVTYSDCRVPFTLRDVPNWPDFSPKNVYDFFKAKHAGRVISHTPTLHWGRKMLPKVVNETASPTSLAPTSSPSASPTRTMAPSLRPTDDDDDDPDET